MQSRQKPKHRDAAHHDYSRRPKNVLPSPLRRKNALGEIIKNIDRRLLS
jgi:hypothetical protein